MIDKIDNNLHKNFKKSRFEKICKEWRKNLDSQVDKLLIVCFKLVAK